MSDLDRKLVEQFVELLTFPGVDRDAAMQALCEHPDEAEAALREIERTIQVLRSQIRAALAASA